MKNIKKLIVTISILLFNISVVFAEATYEQAMKMNSDGFGTGSLTCSELMGPNIVKLIHSSISAVRIFSVIAAILNGMIILLPAVISKDADGLKKASKKCVTIAIFLAVIGVFPSIVKIISGIFDFDMSCLF